MRVSDSLWDRLEEKLDQVPVKEKKPKIFWWRFVAVIILIVSFNGVSWMNDIENKVKNSQDFEFRTDQISSVRQQSEDTDEIQPSIPIENFETENQRLAVENLKDSSTPLIMTENIRKENQTANQVSEKELIIKNEEPKIIPQVKEKLAQNDIPNPKERTKYITSSDLLFSVEIDKAKIETPKSALGINVSKPRNDSDFPNPKRIKLFGITLYDKDSITTK